MKIGIIGIGQMGSIIGHALIKKGYEVILSDRGKKLGEFEGQNIPIKTNIEVAKESDYLILAVKPQVYKKVLSEIKNHIGQGVFISIAAGQKMERLEETLPEKKIILAMTNTPAKVGQAMTAICPNDNVSERELEEVEEIFSSLGKVSLLDKNSFDAFGIIAGCLPAYIFIFIEAAADAAVLVGLNREDSYSFIGQTVLGSAQMLLESKDHPGKLKDMVTSPSGTTIEGLKVLEKKGFRGAIMDAVSKAYNKSKNM